MRVGSIVAAIAVIVLSAGCASTPSPSYYTLDMRASGITPPPCNIQIERLRECEPLARKEILIERSPTEIEYYALDHWAASIAEQVARKLQSEFGVQKDGAPTLSLSGCIENFEQIDRDDGAEAYVRLTVEFRPAGASAYSEPLKRRVYETRMPAEEPDAGAIVKALSRCLEKIAADITADASQIKI